MKRRDFLHAPALGMLLPGALTKGFQAWIPEEESSLPSPQGGDPAPPSVEQRLHQDFSTYTPGIEYFFLGNGEILAALQYCPDRSGELPQTFLGLTLMDAERFARKWSTLLFDPEKGFQQTMLGVVVDGKGYGATPETLRSVAWSVREGVPLVRLIWSAGPCEITEELLVPSQEAMLFRNISVKNPDTLEHAVTLGLALNPNFALFDEIHTQEADSAVVGEGFTSIRLFWLEEKVQGIGRYDLRFELGPVAAGAVRQTQCVYTIRPGMPKVDRQLTARLWKETVEYWSRKNSVVTGNAELDRLYAISRTGLRATVARSGKRDSGIWMYNMEWVRDDVWMTIGALQAGFPEEAKALLTKILEKSVGPDGRTIESSRWFGYDYTELDQNGELLYAVWAYLAWTGDTAFVRKYWDKIASAAEFPLQERFLDPRAGMVRNLREFWERSDGFGVQDGFELAYQFWVALGLEKAAEVAALLGDAARARRWRASGAAISKAMLADPKFRLVEDGHFIKRRTRDGIWHRFMVPPNRATMPPGSPIATEEKPECEPDSSEIYPVVFGTVEGSSDLARNTMQWIEKLWGQRWNFGGYARYNVSSEPDPPAPWALVTLLAARAYTETGDWEKMWRAVRWINEIHGGKSGGWFERYGPSITPPAPPVSVVPWVYAEGAGLAVHHIAGVRPGLKNLEIRPKLPSGVDTLEGAFTVRGARIELRVRRTTAAPYATAGGKKITLRNGALTLAYPPAGGKLSVEVFLAS